jgi:hypothetical protein
MRNSSRGPHSATGKIRDYVAFLSSLGGQFLQVLDSGRPDREYSADEIKSLGARMNELRDEITIMSGRSRERSWHGASEGKSPVRCRQASPPCSSEIDLSRWQYKTLGKNNKTIRPRRLTAGM